MVTVVGIVVVVVCGDAGVAHIRKPVELGRADDPNHGLAMRELAELDMAVPDPPAPAEPSEHATLPTPRPQSNPASTGGPIFPIEFLQQPPFPDGVDTSCREDYLSEEDFKKVCFLRYP